MRSFKVLLVTLLFLGLGLVGKGIALEKVSAIEAAETQKKYERKAVLAVDMGLSTRSVKAVVKECQKKNPLQEKCRTVGMWEYQITQKVEDELAKEIYDWLITQRYDKLIIGVDKALVITASQVMKFEIPPQRFFSFDTGPLSEFETRVSSYLNESLAPIVADLLSAALEVRYQELPEKEQATFMAQKAKELGIPLEVAEKLMSSAFVFAVYYQPMAGEVKVYRKRGLLGTIYYNVKIDVPSKLTLLVYRFDPNARSFSLYFKKPITGYSGKGTGVSQKFSAFPVRDSTVKLFEKSLIMSARAAGISVSTTLKEDDNFAIFATADRVEGNKVYSQIGVLEDLRIDAPYVVRQKREGKTTTVGFVKARHVANNCYKYVECPSDDEVCVREKNSDENRFSRFALIKGKVEFKDQLREHPWTGVFFTAGLGMESFSINSAEDLWGESTFDSGGGSFGVLRLSLLGDLGYTMNSKALSEVWLEIFFSIGAGGDEFKVTDNVITPAPLETDSPLYLAGGVGVHKRIYIGATGIYLAPGLDFLYQLASASIKSSGWGWFNGDIFSIYAYSVRPGVKVGYNFSPNLEAVLLLGWTVPLASGAKIESGNTEVWSADSVDVEGGLSVIVKVDFHVKTVGPFVKFFRKPEGCEKLYEKYKKNK